MKRLSTIAACTGVLSALALAAAPAQAQLMNIPDGNSAAGLTAQQVRVLQFALRDQGCYDGPRNGVYTRATRIGLACARQKLGATDEDALARALGLWSASGDMSTTRSAGGDVAPAMSAPTSTPMTPPAHAGMSNPSMTRDSMMTHDSMMMRDSSKRDSTMRRTTPAPLQPSTTRPIAPSPTPTTTSPTSPSPTPLPTPAPPPTTPPPTTPLPTPAPPPASTPSTRIPPPTGLQRG